MSIVFVGLSITSSWGNGHATTYRGLVRELSRLGHDVLFLERDVPWYRENRDLPVPPFGRTEIYRSVRELRRRFEKDILSADLLVQGSFVPDGIEVGEWLLSARSGLKAFYDIDTPVTLRKLAEGDCEYLSLDLVPRYDLYFSFSGGPVLQKLEKELKARRAVALYCSVDPESHRPLPGRPRWDLGYMGTYSADRQPALQGLLLAAAERLPQGRFCVAGPLYPDRIHWPENVERVEHLAPAEHGRFYNAQRFTLNLTREPMRELGYSPSVRLFEAAACGTPVISDWWEGIEEFFRSGEEILIARSAEEVAVYLSQLTEPDRRAIADRARERTLAEHSARRRAEELVEHVYQTAMG